MIREAKLVGFVFLLVAIFVGARVAGAHLGPVTTSHAQVSYPGQGGDGRHEHGWFQRLRRRPGARARGAAAGRPLVSDTETTLEAELVVGGMTCGSCAARIERRLNRLDGVAATVNYATGRAYFASLGGRDAGELIGVIESTGYTAGLPVPSAPDGAPSADPETRALARRLAVCLPLAAAVIVLAMAPAAQFTGWQWVSLALAAPVAVWGAWPLHRAAWYGLGHGAATMDTLVSVGVGASFGWSVYALLFGGAGMTGMRMSFAFTFGQASGQTLYLEAAAGVTTAVLAGRYLEARARVRSGSALSALAALGAKTVAVLRDGAEQRVPADSLAVGDLFVVRPGEKIATDGVVAEGSSAVDASLVTGESMPSEVGPGDEVTGATVNMSGRLVVRASRVGSRDAARPDHPPGQPGAEPPRPARSGWRTGSPPCSCRA